MGELLHYEDFPAGEIVTYGAYEVTAEEITAFAAEYDPQPFHLDEEAGRASVLGGLCASGWHVCAMMNRMNVDAYLVRAAGMGSFGLEEVKWLRPVFVGDTLSIRRSTWSAGYRRAGRRWGSSSFTGRC
jgi:acyl dehydratase